MYDHDITAVTCASCKATFTEGVIGPEQAHDCAADAHETGVSGNYGSAYDCDHYHWVARPDWVVDGVICDACVHRLLTDDTLAPGYRSSAELFGREPDAERDGDDDDAPVVCASCATVHESVISHKNRQANGCACEADAVGVEGHYGSTVCDLEHWPWANRPGWVRDGVICDACLRKLQAAGAFGRPQGTDPFGGPVGRETPEPDADGLEPEYDDADIADSTSKETLDCTANTTR